MAPRAPRAVCPVTAVVDLVGGKWKIPLLWHLQRGPLRYGALRRAIPGISEKMLGQQLRALAADGLVDRTAYPEIPPRVEYALTERGRTLVPALNALAEWGLDHLDGPWQEAGRAEGPDAMAGDGAPFATPAR